MIDYRKIQTPADLTAAYEAVSTIDQRDELMVGCETWGIFYAGGQRGQMTRWPNGRGAVDFGGHSIWGDWFGDVLVCDDDEGCYTVEGEQVQDD